MNDFDKIAREYRGINFKPDRMYSMLPTLISILDLTPRSEVIDIGCGEGFFTIPIAEKTLKVLGIDISPELLRISVEAQNVEYRCANMFNFDYPKTDRISCPYVLNYVSSLKRLTELFKKFHGALRSGGKIATILDSPKSKVHDNREFGSIKKVNGPLEEGSIIDIELYNNDRQIVAIRSIYHEKKSIEDCLMKAGFLNFEWKDPIVSAEGVKAFGIEYWKRYLKNCDVAYLVANK